VPAKGKSKITEQQRHKIAAGRAAGKTRKAIAAETGLAPGTVGNQASDPRVVTLTLKLKQREEPRITRIYGHTLRTLERDVKSKDNAICAMARGQFLRLLPMGDPPLLRMASADTSGGDFTLEELLISYRKVTVAAT
jgi:hypothetical protein